WAWRKVNAKQVAAPTMARKRRAQMAARGLRRFFLKKGRGGRRGLGGGAGPRDGRTLGGGTKQASRGNSRGLGGRSGRPVAGRRRGLHEVLDFDHVQNGHVDPVVRDRRGRRGENADAQVALEHLEQLRVINGIGAAGGQDQLKGAEGLLLQAGAEVFRAKHGRLLFLLDGRGGQRVPQNGAGGGSSAG